MALAVFCRRMPIDDLKKNEMMAHLIEALNRREDIGHYGRLVLAMVARHFLERDELSVLLQKNLSEEEALALYRQVEEHDYNPPTRERVLEWQQHQQFPICPNPQDPDACNVYKDLKFPPRVYEQIEEYHEQKASGDIALAGRDAKRPLVNIDDRHQQ